MIGTVDAPLVLNPAPAVPITMGTGAVGLVNTKLPSVPFVLC